jgi:hypothetical protein
MRNVILVSITLLSVPASANPTTQACIGDFDSFLACPAGAKRSGTECRAAEAKKGKGDGEHWSGSKRQGPAIFLRDEATKNVSFVAYYKDHKKNGRTFHFDAQGRLESWADMANDTHHGMSVDCSDDGRVTLVSHMKDGKSVGISRHWKRSDGSFSFAYDQAKRTSVDIPAADKVRPDHLCRPQRCDVTTAPDLSGLPK